MMLSVIGAMIESSSEEETEQARDNKREQLKHARAVIDERVMETEMDEVSLSPAP